MPPVPDGRPRTGRVTDFDEPRGIGTVVELDAAGSEGDSYPFHCTALTDGTRSVAVGTAVVFELAATHRGRVEARAMTTVAGPTGAQPG